MLNVGRIEEGFVLDHIKAGKSMTIYHDLKLDKLDCCVAIIKNARSERDPERQDYLKERTASSVSGSQRNPLQKPSLYHFYRTGTGSGIYPDRSGKRSIPLQIL